MDFDRKRNGTGTKEWCEYIFNISVGCQNNCLYCYAADNAANRFKYRDRDQWHIEKFNKRSAIKTYPAKEGVIMFPTTHDITPFNVEEYIRVAKLILGKGNKLLIVSKPREECISKLVSELDKYKKQILFRFTIGSLCERLASFWEPGAPPPEERLYCLYIARDFGFSTSVSIEPMLGGVDETVCVVEEVRSDTTDSIWIGKMNKMRLRVDLTIPENLAAVEGVEALQCDYSIIKLYSRYKDDPIIRWKDSIKDVLSRCSAETSLTWSG